MDNGRGKYLLKNTAIFALGSFGTKIISFFLVPLYTHSLTTSQYGTVDLVTTICVLLMPVLILNIGESVMRFALDEGANREKIICVGLAVLVFAAVLGMALVPVTRLFETIGEYSWYIYLYVLSASINQVLMCNLRGMEKLLAYSVGNILHTFAVAGFNVLFLLVFKFGVKGYFCAYILANIFAGLYAFLVGNVSNALKHFQIDKVLAKKMIVYSAVLIPNSFMWWITDSFDRLLITAMLGSSANGLYAVANKIPTMLASVSSIFSQAWLYSAIKENSSEDKAEYSNSVLRILMALLAVLVLGVLLIIKWFMRVYVESSYYSAWEYVPFLLLGVFFSVINTFVGTSYSVNKDSKGFLLSATVGALTNIILSVIFIPIWGCSGAALATCMSYFFVLVFRLVHTRKYLRLNVMSWKNVLSVLLLVAAVLVVKQSWLNETPVLIAIIFAEFCLFSDVYRSILKAFFKKQHA